MALFPHFIWALMLSLVAYLRTFRPSDVYSAFTDPRDIMVRPAFAVGCGRGMVCSAKACADVWTAAPQRYTRAKAEGKRQEGEAWSIFDGAIHGVCALVTLPWHCCAWVSHTCRVVQANTSH